MIFVRLDYTRADLMRFEIKPTTTTTKKKANLKLS